MTEMIKLVWNILLLTFSKLFQITEKWLQFEIAETKKSFILDILTLILAQNNTVAI